MRAGRFGGSSRLQGRTATGGRWGGVSSSFGSQSGNGLRVTAVALAFLASAQPYTVNGGNKISVADSRSAGGTYGITIAVSSGSITLSGTTGLSFSVGDGTADATMTFTGSLANINTALDGLSINGASAGSRTVTVTFSHAATSRSVGKTISATVGVVVANSVAPVISGDLDYGNVLTVSDGTWTGTPAPTFTYQWQNGGTNISGQTSNTYTTVAGDLGDTITCEVTGTNAFNSVMAESAGVVITDPAATAPVLSNFVDFFDQDPPYATFDTSEEGTLTWDFHSSATPPSIGGGDIATGTVLLAVGFPDFEPDLTAYAGQTGYMHMRLTATDDAQVSNILTSQQFTVPSSVTTGLLMEDGTSFILMEDGSSILLMEG